MSIVDLSDKTLGVDAAAVRSLRDAGGGSMMDCKRYLKKQALVHGIKQSEDLEDLRNAMLRMCEMMVFRA